MKKVVLIASLAFALGTAAFPARTEATPPAPPASPPPPTSVLKVSAVPIRITDVDRALKFYRDGLGLTMTFWHEMPGRVEIGMAFPGGEVGLLILARTGAAKADGAAAAMVLPRSAIFAVPDLKALEARLVAAGYQLKGPIMDVESHKVLVALVADPDGNTFELIQRKP